jgi:hypothetical protein
MQELCRSYVGVMRKLVDLGLLGAVWQILCGTAQLGNKWLPWDVSVNGRGLSLSKTRYGNTHLPKLSPWG